MADTSSAALSNLVDYLMPIMEGTRQRRKFIEHEWLQNYRAWQGWPATSYMILLPDNAVRYFIPHARRAIERNVARGVKLLMPNMDWHQTLPFDGLSHQNAEAVHQSLRYIYQKKIPTKRNISSGLRSLQMYNFAVLHTSAIIQRDEVWPFQKTVDAFNFYIFPDTATNAEEAQIIFEDSIIPYESYMSFVDQEHEQRSLYKFIKAEDLQTPEWPYHLIERLSYRGLSQPSDFVQGAGSSRKLRERDFRKAQSDAEESLSMRGKTFVALSKVYFRKGSNWYFCVLCTNCRGSGDTQYNAEVLRLDEVENQPLYRWCNSRPLPGELYTNSPTDDIRVLQNLTNNALSQVEANRSRFAEPPIVINANMYGRMDQKVFGNRLVWLIDGDPNEAIKSLDVEDTSTNGIRAVQIYKGMLDQNSGGGLPEGQPGRNMPRAGFAANTLLNMSLTDVEEISDFYEQDCLTPGLSDVYHILLEYVPDSQIIKIPGKHPELVKAFKKKDLYGDFSFNWLGSLGFQDVQTRADKFMQLGQFILNPQILPLVQQQLAQNKEIFDIGLFIKTLWSYGLGERGLGEIIRQMNEQELQALNQPSPEMQQKQQELQQNQQQNQQQAQLKQQESQQQMQFEGQKHQMEMQKLQADLQKALLEHKLDTESKVLDFHAKRADVQNRMLTSMIPSNGAGNERKQK